MGRVCTQFLESSVVLPKPPFHSSSSVLLIQALPPPTSASEPTSLSSGKIPFPLTLKKKKVENFQKEHQRETQTWRGGEFAAEHTWLCQLDLKLWGRVTRVHTHEGGLLLAVLWAWRRPSTGCYACFHPGGDLCISVF